MGTRSPFDGLSVLVSTRFQVLFHSPPGVLFTFPSRYSSLSVTRWYLEAWRVVVPPVFPRDFTCPAVLWIQLPALHFAYVILTLSDWPSHAILLCSAIHSTVRTPSVLLLSVLASSAFARHYQRNLILISLPRPT